MAVGSGHRTVSLDDDVIDVGPAINCSHVVQLHGRPYPVQFRNQGAIEAWTRALGDLDVWTRWAHPQTAAWHIRREVLWQWGHMHPLSQVPEDEIEAVTAHRQLLAIEVSSNLKYHLAKGTVIEATPALETLLTNSDMDLSLPMSMVAPPYPAQYLRFGEAVMQYLKVPDSEIADRFFDGVFCFFTPPSPHSLGGPTSWTLELVFISKRHDRCGGHVALIGATDRGDTPVGAWLEGVLEPVAHEPLDDYIRPMHAAVSYVVKLFLYMGLRQARAIEHREYDEALRRAAGLGERKRGKLLQRSASLYNGILVGPEPAPSATVGHGGGGGVAPHWRRGHFRMQPYGPGKQERKLIFVAPILIHADQIQGEAPAPKPYRAGVPSEAMAS
jgi:hypothetical protein